MITHISFDLDGTLEFGQFDKIVWNVEIPKLYAKEHNVSLEEAQRCVYAEYYKALYIEHVSNWTDITMWFHRLSLTGWEELLESMREHIHLYDDVDETLTELGKSHTLVLITISEAKFLDLKLRATGLRKHFKHIVSSNTFMLSKKDKGLFERSLKALHITPEQMVHVGNEIHADYEVPMSCGVRSYLIDRKGGMSGEHVIHSLRELKEKI